MALRPCFGVLLKWKALSPPDSLRRMSCRHEELGGGPRQTLHKMMSNDVEEKQSSKQVNHAINQTNLRKLLIVPCLLIIVFFVFFTKTNV